MNKIIEKVVDWFVCHLMEIPIFCLLLWVLAAVLIAFNHEILGSIVFVVSIVIAIICGIVFKLCVEPVSQSKNEPVSQSKNVPKGFPDGITWNGLGDEPKWEGEIPVVTDYTEPRYIYANGHESSTYNKYGDMVVGYRISPTLVIHNMVAGGNGWFREHIRPFIERYGGELLNAEDVAILRKNYPAVDAMRKKAGDAGLPRRFWYKGKFGSEVAYLEEEKDEYDPDCSGIILKRPCV